jgi:hypothetical protein
MIPKRISKIVVFFLILLFNSHVMAAGEWYKLYEEGIEAMQDGDYKTASELFIEAIQDNPDDNDHVRTYGMHFIEYYPHRELGICLYQLGDKTGAQQELQISMKMEPSERAKLHLSQLGAGLPPYKKSEPEKEVAVEVVAAPAVEQKKETEMIVGKQTIKLVGERMGVAVLPFENKGASNDLGEIILDKMITVLWTQERFKVMERAALNQVLAEQSLGQSGALDANTAAEIGKGIGVDAIVIGSVVAAPSGALSIDTRVIDTESAAIIVENLARKITESLPLVDGYVIRIDGTELIIDVGRNGGLKKGMKCVIYKEGAPIKHPITGEILGKETKVIGEILVTDSFDKYSVAKQLTLVGTAISIGDKFITK